MTLRQDFSFAMNQVRYVCMALNGLLTAQASSIIVQQSQKSRWMAVPSKLELVFSHFLLNVRLIIEYTSESEVGAPSNVPFDLSEATTKCASY